MSVSYSINWMGPINMKWIEEHGDCWSAGRIDIRDSSKEGYDGWHEYSVAPMKTESWNKLGDWLWDLETTEVLDYEMLISIFEGETGHKIEWLENE